MPDGVVAGAKFRGYGARILIKFNKTFASCKSDKKFASRNVLLGLASPQRAKVYGIKMLLILVETFPNHSISITFASLKLIVSS